MKIRRKTAVLLSAMLIAAMPVLSAKASSPDVSSAEESTGNNVPVALMAVAAGGLISIGIVKFKGESEEDDDK